MNDSKAYPVILHIIPTLARGGAETLLSNTIPLLKSFHHVVVVFEKVQKEVECNGEVIYLNLSIPRSWVRGILKLRKLIREIKPEIINAHLYWSVILIRFCNTKRIKTFEWYHSDMYNEENTEQFNKQRLWLDKLTQKKSNFKVFVSSYLKDSYSKKIPSKSKKYMIHNFVHSDFFEIQRKPKIDDQIKLLVVGNLRKQKNHEVVLRALSTIPDAKFSTTIVGDGPLRFSLEKLSRELKLKDIQFVGVQENIHSFLSEADIFIMPSLFEGFGISLVEAMAAGLPCIVSDIPVFREVAEDNVMYFNPLNPIELANNLVVLEKTELREKFGQLGFNKALKFNAAKYKVGIQNLFDLQ